MTAHEQPISYLDSILSEEEKRCEYSHQWRNFTISRSGRFKSKNRRRDVVDGKLFDASNAPSAMSASASSKSSSTTVAAGQSRVMATATMNPHFKQESDKNTYCQASAASSKLYPTQSISASASSIPKGTTIRDKAEIYKSYYETNL